MKPYKAFLVTCQCRKQLFRQKSKPLKAKELLLLGHLLLLRHVMLQRSHSQLRGKKRQFKLHLSPCKICLYKTLGVKSNRHLYSENATNDVLKHFCRLNNLAVGGKKVELISRLHAHFQRYGLDVESQLKALTWSIIAKESPSPQRMRSSKFKVLCRHKTYYQKRH